jgi:hypothetical protein
MLIPFFLMQPFIFIFAILLSFRHYFIFAIIAAAPLIFRC